MHGCGARGKSKQAKEVYKENGILVIGKRRAGACFFHAVSNAIARLCGVQYGRQFSAEIEQSLTCFKSIRSLQPTLHKFLSYLNFRRFKGKNFVEEKWLWLSNLSRGLWLVRVRTGTDMSHCILVDRLEQKLWIPMNFRPWCFMLASFMRVLEMKHEVLMSQRLGSCLTPGCREIS